MARCACPRCSLAREPDFDHRSYYCYCEFLLGSHGPGPHRRFAMSAMRKIAIVVLLAACFVSLAANLFAPFSYEKQFRNDLDSPPSKQYPLGTDELGRDRFSRLLYGMRVSLLLAPAAALLSTLLSAVLGGLGAYIGGIWDRLTTFFIDLFLSLPWLFLLLTVRALLPLNVPPATSVTVTFTLLGLLGWAASARVVHA